MSGRTKEERDRIKSQKQNAAAKKKKKETGKSSSSSKKKVQQATETAKKAMQSFGKTYGENVKAKAAERKTKNTTVSRDEYDNRVRQSYGERNGLRLPSVFDDPRETPTLSRNDQKTALQNMRTRLEEAEQSEKEKQSSAGDRFSVWNEDRRNPLTKTAVRTPERDVRAGNTGRTREELERRTSTRDLAQTTADDWLKLNRSAVALKDNEKAGVGLGTIRHGRMNENAEFYTNNWSSIPKEYQVNAVIQMIYSDGVNDKNRDMVTEAFSNATTYDQRKIMDAVVQTDGWSDVAYDMRRTINNAPDAEQALMQQIGEDMNVRNGNYLDTFKQAANKAVVDQYNLQQKEDKVIADWAKENYDTGEALKYAVEQSVSGWLVNAYDAIALAHSDLMQAGQQDDITDGVGAPWRNVKNVQGFGNKVASVGTTVLHDLFRIAGLPISLLSKATYTPEEVNRITEKLMGVTDWYQESVRNNQVALEASNLSEGQKTIAEITGTVIDQIPGIVMAVIGTPAAGMTTFGVQAGGKYGRSAYEQGASIEEAVKFGLSAAAAEVATEKLFTGFGYFGKGLSSKVLNDTTRKMIENSAFKNSIAADMLKRVVAGGGEATEEMIMEILTPYLERSTYDPAADGATMEEILRSGGLGFVVAQILGLPANALGVTGNILEKADTRRQEQIVSSQIRDEITAAVERGEISEQDAVNINAQIKDMQSGKGSLMQSEVQEEQKTTGENLDNIYANFDEAREALQAEAKGKADGETVTARFMENGEAKLWTAKVMNGNITQVQPGITTKAENEKYTAKAAKVASATNTAERTGYQLNVRDDIVKEVSALSKAFSKEVEFYYDEDVSVHGNTELDTGKIYVNINSSQSPAAAVIAHEMTHLLENTSSYKTLTDMMQKYYASSLEDKRNDIIAIYKSNPKALKTILDKNGKIRMDVIDSEVMAAFIEEKLLTDYNTIRELTREDRTLAQKIVDWINNIIQKITGNKEQRFLMEARDMWNKALQEDKSNKKAPKDGAEMRYSVGKITEEDTVNNIKYVSRMESVANITGQEFPRIEGQKVNKRIIKYMNQYRLYNPQVGEIVFNNRSIKDDLAHGVGKLKIASYVAVPHVLSDGKVVTYRENWKDRGYDTLTVAAPITVDGEPYFEGVILKRTQDGNRFYLHEVWMEEDKKNSTASSQPGGSNAVDSGNAMLSMNSILQRIIDVKYGRRNAEDVAHDFMTADPYETKYSIGRSKDAAYMDAVNRGDMAEAQRMVDEAAKAAGYKRKAFHETKQGNTIHVFNMELATNASGDYKTPYGIFTKSHNRSVGLGGKQMALYVKAKKTFEAKDRDDFETKMPEQYWDLVNELKSVNKKYDQKENDLEDRYFDLIDDFFDNHPNGDQLRMQSNAAIPLRDQFDLPADLETVEIELENIMGEWESAEKDAIATVKKWLTNWLKANGYDSMSLDYDNGAGNRVTDAFIVLKENQIKSADPVTYDDDGNVIPLSERFNEESEDIRWSIGRSTKTELNDLIKSHGTAMREVFHNRRRADHKELWDMIKDEVSHIVQTGASRRNVVDAIVRLAYETGYINNAVESEELGENTWGKGIYIPEEYKGEMATLGGLRSINGLLRNSGLFLTYNRMKKGSDERYGGLDEAYSDLQASNPILPDTIDPAEQVEALIELFSKTDERRTLEELDEEAYAMGEESAPYLTDIRRTVENAMDEIATFARWKLMQDSREEGIQEGIKRGKKTGASEQERKQRKLDEATLREFDKLNKQRAEDERKQDEATMRMHDRLIKEVYNEAKSLSAEEKRDIRRAVKEKGEEKMKKELAKRAAQYQKERSNARKNLNAVMKEAEKQAKNYERKLTAQENKAMRKQQEKTDRERRAERLRIVKEEYKRNAPKPAEGTVEAKYLESNSAKELIGRFRRNIITYLVEHERFISPNEGVVLDENGMEIAYLNSNEEWEISKHKNTYTPSWGLTLLAEKEGIDRDVFFTIYSKIADMRTKRKKDGNLEYKKSDIVQYIAMLDLTAKQKDFLYFDVAKYAYIKKPTFLAGGAIKEKAGNQRGRMMEALDNIAIDMYAGAMKDVDLFDAESSAQIQYKDIAAFADAVYGREDSKEKDDFMMFFCGSIMEYSDQMETVRMLEKTKLLTDKPKEKNSVKMQILRAYRESKRLFVAEGEAFERMGEKLKNPLITARYYGARKSSAIANEMIYGKTQRDLQGKNNGKSLYEIFKPVFRADEKAGNNNNMKELTELVNCRHDIYRLRNGKGYTGYSIEECEKIVDRISREHPELLKVADEIAEYGRNLLRMCVESGRISQTDFDYFTAKYPYYAPTFRLRSNEYIDRKGNVVRRDTKVIRTAVGGNDDVLPLFDQFVRRTQEIVKACKKNQLASELAKTYTLPNSAEYIRDVRKAEKQEDKEKDIASLGEVEDIGRARKEDGNENIIPWYSNGQKYDIEVEDEALLYGWDRIAYRRNEYAIATAFRKMNNIRRGVLTQYNPTFWLTNGIKDIQDMYLYNQHAQRLPKFHLEAAKTMFAGTFGKGKNEEALEEYLSFGMSQASIFEYDNTNSGRRTKRARVNEAMRKPIDAFNALNFMVEQTPRLAVYNEAVDRLSKERKNGENTYTDEEIKTIAAYQASDATLNFGRSGTVIKEMNTYGFTFLNAGVQGMDRFRRMFTQIKDGNKRAILINICGLIMKLGIVGVGWNVLTDWIYGGDDEYAEAIREALYGDDKDKIAQEYAEMADYQRTNYMLLNIDGVWIRIPKGRLASFIYGFVYNGEKVYSGEMDALDLITAQLDLASETILFSNPITNNILGPFVDVWRNKDAWDVDIVSEYEDMGEGFHYLEYDEETTDLAIKIAEFGHYLTADLFGEESSRILDISPKKLDYLIEQYLGSYANMIMPFLSKEQDLKDNAIGALESLIKKFYIDPTSSNRLAGDYYDLKEEFENAANAHENDSPYAVAAKVFDDYTDQLKVLRDEINAIDADSSLSKREKLAQISELREQMNELYRQGISDAKDALGFAHANYYGKDGNSELYEEWQKTSKGADWVITTMSDAAQEKYAIVEKDGVDAENFVNAYSFISNATADKDENGKSINGSKKEKIVNYLNTLDLTADQKMSLYTNVAGYKVSDRAPAPSFVNGALIQPSTSNMAAPIAGGGRLTSEYGWRTCPFHGREFHQAVDIAAESGTDVGAVISGTVTMATVHGGYGNSIEITSTDENGNTVVTKYNHLLNMGVEVGDVINQGTKIGEVGSTGSSTGPHLDFRLKINDDWVDPTQYIDLEASGVVDATGYTQKEGSGGTASSGGYSGGSGSGSRKSTSSYSASERKSTNYDSVTKISGNKDSNVSSGYSKSSDGGSKNLSSTVSSDGVVLPTAAQITEISSRNVTGRSTKSATYGKKGVYLPRAGDYNAPRITNFSTSVATTKRTGRTGGSLWDENILS